MSVVQDRVDRAGPGAEIDPDKLMGFVYKAVEEVGGPPSTVPWW